MTTKSQRLAAILNKGGVPTKHDQHSAAIHILAHAAALKLAREALSHIADALPKDKDTVKTCYAICNSHRDAAHAALAAIDNLEQET